MPTSSGPPFIDSLKDKDQTKRKTQKFSHQHRLQGNAARLPLSWVPAVRKRALEVDLPDDSNSSDRQHASTTMSGSSSGQHACPVGSLQISVPLPSQTATLYSSPERSVSPPVDTLLISVDPALSDVPVDPVAIVGGSEQDQSSMAWNITPSLICVLLTRLWISLLYSFVHISPERF